jgi:hypothetical protein
MTRDMPGYAPAGSGASALLAGNGPERRSKVEAPIDPDDQGWAGGV